MMSWRRGINAMDRSTRIFVLACVASAVLVCLGIAWTQGWPPVFTAREPVVAVLPTRNLSEAPSESAYLSEAFGEALVTRLSHVSSVRLLPWSTTQRFTDPKQKLKATGRELNADKLVVGSYSSDGERLRVTVALVDARTGNQTWTKAYESGIEEVFALQRNVATGVAMYLSGGLTEAERNGLGADPSPSPDAYEYYLRGSNCLRAQDRRSVSLAGPHFEKALELDPNLAAAWVGRGTIEAHLHFRGHGGVAALDEAERAFRHALNLDSSMYSAARGSIRVAYERNQPEKILQIGMSLAAREDDVEALQTRAEAYFMGGLPDRALPLLDRVLELDPGSQTAAWFRVVAESWSGQTALAIKHGKAYLRKYPRDQEIYTWLGMSFYLVGDKLQARHCFSQAVELVEEGQSGLHPVFFSIGLYRELGEKARADSLAECWLDSLDARSREFPDKARLRGTRRDFALLLAPPRLNKELEGLLADAEGQLSLEPYPLWGSFPLSAGFLAIADIPRIRRALSALPRSNLAAGYAAIRNGVLRLALGERYPMVEQSPEFRAYLAAVKQRHDELAARY